MPSNLDLPVVTRGVRAQPAPKIRRLYINKDESAGVTMAQPCYSLSCGSLQTTGEVEAFQIQAGKKTECNRIKRARIRTSGYCTQ